MEIVTALVIALVLSALFSSKYRAQQAYIPLLVFFTILFLVVLAGQLWITPFGPVWWGVAWLPLFFIGLIFAFILMAATPFPTSGRKSVKEEIREEEATGIAIGLFTWLLLIALVVAIVTGYYRRSGAPQPVRDMNDLTSAEYE